MMNVMKNLRRTHENIMKVVGMFDLWDEMSGSHDQGNQSRNGFVHQTVALVEKAMLEESAR